MPENEKKYSTSYIILYVFLILILLLILTFLNLRQKNAVFYEWWNNNNGLAYNKFLNLDHTLVARDTFLMYYLTLPLGNNVSNLDIHQVIFLFEFIFPHIIFNNNGRITGFVKPRHVTKSILLDRGDSVDFDKWCIKNNKIPSVVLKYDANGKPTPDSINGIYPAPRDRLGWKYKFAEWGVPVSAWKETKDGNLLPELSGEMINEWYSNTYSDTDEKQHPDNFLSMYGILPDSPLCASFINQSYNISGIVLDEESLVKLIGGVAGGNPGGWVGYMKGLGTNEKDLYTTYMMSVLHGDQQKIAPQVETSCSGSGAAGWTSAVAAGIGVAATAAFFGTGGVGFFIFLGLGLFTAISQSPPVQCALSKT